MENILVYGLNNVRGGIEKYLLDMQKMLSNDVKFTYMMEQCECVHHKEIAASDGELLFFPGRKPLGDYLSNIRCVLELQRNECKTLYMNLSDVTLDNLIVMLLGLRYHYRVAVHAHAARLEIVPNLLHRCLHRMVVIASRLIFSLGSVECYAVSDQAGAYLFGKRPFSIVTPGIDIQKFAFDAQKRQEVRSRYGFQNDYIYGFVGRLVEIKNPEYLIKTFHNIVCKSTRSCRLLLVGDGPLREGLQAQAKQLGLESNVIFVGNTDDPIPYYHAMDYLILPSKSEGLSLVAIEAQASGLPIACSAGRFPSTIHLTPLLSFFPLEDGADAWADACIAHGQQFAGENREKWNHTIRESCFEMNVAAERLKQVLTATKE